VLFYGSECLQRHRRRQWVNRKDLLVKLKLLVDPPGGSGGSIVSSMTLSNSPITWAGRPIDPVAVEVLPVEPVSGPEPVLLGKGSGRPSNA
jgi:hypothetical protein